MVNEPLIQTDSLLTLTVLQPLRVLPLGAGGPALNTGHVVCLNASDQGTAAFADLMGCGEAWGYLSAGAMGMVEIPAALLADVEVSRRQDGEAWSFTLRNRRTGATLDPLAPGGFPDGRMVNDLATCIDLVRAKGGKVVLGVVPASAAEWYARTMDGIRIAPPRQRFDGDDARAGTAVPVPSAHRHHVAA